MVKWVGSIFTFTVFASYYNIYLNIRIINYLKMTKGQNDNVSFLSFCHFGWLNLK